MGHPVCRSVGLGGLEEVGAETFGTALEEVDEDDAVVDVQDLAGAEPDVTDLVAFAEGRFRGGGFAVVGGLVGAVDGFDGFYLLVLGEGGLGLWDGCGLRGFAAEELEVRLGHAVRVLLGAVVAAQAGVALVVAEIGADDAGAAAGGFGVVHHFGQVLLVAVGPVDVGLEEGGELLGGGVGVGVRARGRRWGCGG